MAQYGSQGTCHKTTTSPFFFFSVNTDVFDLSLDRVLKSLVSLGISQSDAEVYIYLDFSLALFRKTSSISQSDAEVYIYLANEDPIKAIELANALIISRQKHEREGPSHALGGKGTREINTILFLTSINNLLKHRNLGFNLI
jgi:hypothetical protein